jgi:hypothetical protein
LFRWPEGWGLGRDIGLGWASPRPLAGHHGAAQEELAAPYAPRFLALQGAREAGDPHWAFVAHGLGCLDVLRGLCEEQVRALGARQHGPGARNRHDGRGRTPYSWYGLRFQPRRARCNGGGGGPVLVDPLSSLSSLSVCFGGGRAGPVNT